MRQDALPQNDKTARSDAGLTGPMCPNGKGRTVRAALSLSAVGVIAVAGLSPASAATAIFTPPKGCHVEFTAQLHGCRVENHYRCDADPAGERRISFADQTGEYFISQIDSETRWIASVSPQDGTMDALDAKASADNASFTTLLATGRDDYDFVTRSNSGETQRYIGYDHLTGESVTIGGQPLERTEFSIRIEGADGQLLATREGHQLISRSLRVFFGDTETFTPAGAGPEPDTSTPVSIAFPGQSGFAAAKPIFDCDMQMSLMSANPHHPTL